MDSCAQSNSASLHLPPALEYVSYISVSWGRPGPCHQALTNGTSVLSPGLSSVGPQLPGSSPSCHGEKMIGFRNLRSPGPPASWISHSYPQSTHVLQEVHQDRNGLRYLTTRASSLESRGLKLLQ